MTRQPVQPSPSTAADGTGRAPAPAERAAQPAVTTATTPRARTAAPHAAPREPLLIFRGQAVAGLLPILLGLMSLLAVFFVLQSMQRLFVIQSALRVADSELTVIVPTAPGLPDTAEDPALIRALDVLEATVGLTRIRTLDEAATRRAEAGTALRDSNHPTGPDAPPQVEPTSIRSCSVAGPPCSACCAWRPGGVLRVHTQGRLGLIR